MKQLNYHYTYDKTAEPLCRINSGDTVTIETEDALRGLIKTEEDLTEEILQDLSDLHVPLSGPVYVNGSKPGDWLEIKIDNINIKDYGVMLYGGSSTCLPEIFNEQTLVIAKIKDNFIYFTDNIKVPTKPMIGSIGTAPSWGVPRSPLQGDWGGNMDCPLIIKGNVLYLPVFVEGAFLYMGDCHAIQGEGELIATFETAAEITLTVNLINDKCSKGKCPRLITKDSIITIYSDRTTELGMKYALFQMIQWLEEDFHFTRHEAAVLCAQVANGRACQILDPICTSMVLVAKEYANLKSLK